MSIENRAESRTFLFGHLKQSTFLTVFAGMGLSFLLFILNVDSTVLKSANYALDSIGSLQQPMVYILLGAIVARLSDNFKSGLMIDSKLALVD